MTTGKNASHPGQLSSKALISFWTVRISLLFFHIAYFLYIITLLVRWYDDPLMLYIQSEVRDGGFTRTMLTALAMAVLVVCVALEVTCIVKHTRASLSPRFLLFAAALQALLWTAIFAASMALYHDRIICATGIALTISLYGFLFFAIFAAHKARGAPTYEAFDDEEQMALKQDTSYDPMRSMGHVSIRVPPPSKYEPVRGES